ncbi:MAG: hypothetical protein PHI64_19720 [Zoogloea sp.]|uniref:hypothetical protein n=1 Tax=Zoogloea sp. TaxID=49181 RepID=UPI0026391D33|nr:hypothetical protein [Zoogloea sp.]MDD2991169.1 hypothetical protein [Zoogloea sp.]
MLRLHGLVEITHADPQQFTAATAGFAGHYGAAGAEVDGYCPALNVATRVACNDGKAIGGFLGIPPQLPQTFLRIGQLSVAQDGKTTRGVIKFGEHRIDP